MVPVVQLVRASDCGSECRGFESHRAPSKEYPCKHQFVGIILFIRFSIIFKVGSKNSHELN